MAIHLKENVLEMVRQQKTPYWRIYDTEQKRQAGNYVAMSDFDNPELGIEASIDLLRTTLNRLTPGRYIFTAFQKADGKRSGIDTPIEVEGFAGRASGIGSTGGSAGKFIVAGIGEVTPENFEEVLEKKFKKLQEELAEKQRIKNLEEENRRLKLEARSSQSGINKGLIAVGAMVYPSIIKTDAGKNIVKMIGGFLKGANTNTEGNTEADSSAEEETISGTGEAEERLQNALERLARDNPQVVDHLEMLAKTKEENPDLYEQGLNIIKEM